MSSTQNKTHFCGAERIRWQKGNEERQGRQHQQRQSWFTDWPCEAAPRDRPAAAAEYLLRDGPAGQTGHMPGERAACHFPAFPVQFSETASAAQPTEVENKRCVGLTVSVSVSAPFALNFKIRFDLSYCLSRSCATIKRHVSHQVPSLGGTLTNLSVRPHAVLSQDGRSSRGSTSAASAQWSRPAPMRPSL